MNSINHSFESFDSCGRAFIMILRLCEKPLSQYLFLRQLFFSFRPWLTDNLLIVDIPKYIKEKNSKLLGCK